MQKTLIFFVIGLAIGGGALYGLQYQKGLSAQEAADKAIEFINANIEDGVTASLIDVSEESDVYKIHLQTVGQGYEPQEYESYITKDGKLLFSFGIRLEDTTGETSQEEAIVSPENLDSFAQCLTEKGAKFYGAWWCPHCLNQKDMFGDSFSYINYIECEKKPGESQWDLTQECQEAEITGFPTWDFSDGTRKSGEMPLEILSELSGCQI